MMRDITIGQYYPADSVIHKLDPRVKLFSTMLLVVAVFVARGILGAALLTLGIAACIRLSKVPFRFMVRGLRAIATLITITALCNLFFTSGNHVYWQYGILRISDTGIVNAVVMFLRLTWLILGTSLMTLTTTPNRLTDGLEKSLRPLNRLHVPVHSIAMMMSIALRFIPILIEETDKIMKAQMARGADFESGNIIRKAKNMVPLLVPLIVSAFRRADDLAMAMEARCYNGGEGRTKMKLLRYEKRDRTAYLTVILYLALLIVARNVYSWPQV